MSRRDDCRGKLMQADAATLRRVAGVIDEAPAEQGSATELSDQRKRNKERIIRELEECGNEDILPHMDKILWATERTNTKEEFEHQLQDQDLHFFT